MRNTKKVRKKKINAFTLIELIAVLVILAIISLIVAPFLLNIIRRVKDVANKRSVDGYGRAVEYAMASYQLEHLAYPDTFDKLEIEYKGNKVECKTNRINPDYSIYLSECKVNGRLVKNDKEIDGFYHYGILKMTNQEYVDTYGKNLEDALKSYHDEHNEYPNDYTTLTLPPLDKEVSCDVRINYEGSVYLTKCSVNEEEVTDENTKDNYYHYGTKKYGIGDEVEYNGIEFYVINNSNDASDSVILLKDTPLTVDEVNLYGGVETENNHVNLYQRPTSTLGKANNFNGYGGMFYYTTETCGYTSVSDTVSTGCTTDYNESDVKYVVDNWEENNFQSNDLKIVDGISARLISIEDLERLGYIKNKSGNYPINSNIPTWFYNSNYAYYTMTPLSSHGIYIVATTGSVSTQDILYRYAGSFLIRPVVTLKKSALE